MSSVPNGLYTRQKDFFDHRVFDDVLIHVVGAGGIGSPTCLALSKIGAKNIVVYDDDVVEAHNVPNQMLLGEEKYYGSPKVSHVREVVKLMGCPGVKLHGERRRVTPDTPFIKMMEPYRHVVVCGPDSMEARKGCWKIVSETPTFNVVGYVEARMMARAFMMYTGTVNSLKDDDYESMLHDDSENEQVPCSDKAVFHTNLILAGCICESVRRLVLRASGHEVVDWQFETLFDLSTMSLMGR